MSTAEPVPLAEQIAGSVRRALAESELAAGERLPTAADLAAVLEVNPNTVLLAYRRLRDEGFVEFRRGRGVRVRADVEASAGAVAEAVRSLVALGRRHGYPPAELARLIAQA